MSAEEYKHYGIVLCPSVYGITVCVTYRIEQMHCGGSSFVVRRLALELEGRSNGREEVAVWNEIVRQTAALSAVTKQLR